MTSSRDGYGVTPVDSVRSSLAGRLIQVFLSPIVAFSSIGVPRWSDWMVPVMLSTVVTISFIYFTQPIITEAQNAVVQMQLENNPNLSADQREQILQNMASFENTGKTIGVIFASVGVLAFVILSALMCFLSANVILGANVTYLQMLTVAGYSYLIGIPEAIVKIPLILVKNSMSVYTGLGLFLTEEMATQTFMGRLAAGVDLFGIWQVCILGIGIAVLGRVALTKSLVTMFILWMIWLASKAYFSELLSTFNPIG